MKALQQAIEKKLKSGGKCFVPYIMAGDGGLDKLIPRLEFLQNAGAAMIEIGIPFSDPAADGPVIQAAGMRAMKEGTTLEAILDEMEDARKTIHIPLIFMTYLNPLMAMGIPAFAERCARIGIDACIIPDVPLEEEEEIRPILNRHGIAQIRLASITSPPDRLEKLAEGAQGFIYAVTVKGVTGTRTDIPADTIEYIRRLRKLSPVPVFAGFGISTAAHVQMIGEHCDGVIVGSQIINHFQKGEEDKIVSLIEAAHPAYI